VTRHNSNRRPIRVGLVSLGCAKNLVDAEIMLGALLQEGMEITNDAARADALIVNTCSFIAPAQEESVDAILEAAAARDARRPEQSLIVAGCLPQRFREELPALLPEVDAFMGVDQVAQVAGIVKAALARRAEKLRAAPARPERGDANRRARTSRVLNRFAELDTQRESPLPVDTAAGTTAAGAHEPHSGSSAAPLVHVDGRPHYVPDYATPRFRLTPRHFAYVKIAEGCNHPCSFCIIPRIRGPHRSRPQADIVAEARALLAQGVRELNLISQDTTWYGLDLRPRGGGVASPEKFAAVTRALPEGTPTLCTLLRELNALPGQFWIRLLYTHPAHWTDDLIRTIAECPKVARYADIPLQHIHDNMLERMRRETSRAYLEDLLRRIRAGVPGIALRTTFIVGFPGETEACFEALCAFIRETRFERLGAFAYSPETGTRAALMRDQIPEPVKRRRLRTVMAIQREIARAHAARCVGRELTVLVESRADAAALSSNHAGAAEHGALRVGRTRAVTLRGGDFVIARSEADAPDIDGRVFVRGRLPVGEFARVRVVDHTDYDLIAEPV
jgi:ribosomal protein S12 methylthiotransferase